MESNYEKNSGQKSRAPVPLMIKGLGGLTIHMETNVYVQDHRHDITIAGHR
jgi:hypothetical protein